MKFRFPLSVLPAFSALALSLASLGGAHASTLVNGDFAQGLNGWQAAGDASVQGGTVLGIDLGTDATLVLGNASSLFDDDAPEAAGAYNLSGNEPLLAAEPDGLEASVGLSVGAFGLDAQEGSSALQSFSVQAGEQISFDWRLLTRAGLDATDSPDTAWLVWADGAQTQLIALGRTDGLSGDADAAGWLDSGWQHLSFTATVSGSVSLAFAVTDGQSFTGSSLLALRQVQASAVPEPTSAFLALAGLASACLMRRRRHTQT